MPRVYHRGTDPRTDAELASALRGGDASGFEAFDDRYHDWVAAFAFRVTAHRGDALDVLQETFAGLFRRSRDFELHRRMKTFLYRVVKHLSIARRHAARRQDPLNPTFDPVLPPERSAGPPIIQARDSASYGGVSSPIGGYATVGTR
ncbi:MAG TPA: RNA polymerase sigma factor [Planctomycetota bacterium]|nr:RNA polymerase sigma factor [Planctomycetota bacterium]